MNFCYRELLKIKAALDAEILEVESFQRLAAIAMVQEIIAQYQLEPHEIFNLPIKRRARIGAPKYWNPETGETWTGQGFPPAWIIGKNRALFSI